MVSVLACMEGRSEKDLLVSVIRKLAAKLSDDEWLVKAYENAEEADSFLQSGQLVDLACCNVSKSNALFWTERFRKTYKHARLLLIADSHTSPVLYLRPQIMASSLLLKPYNREELTVVLEDFIRAFLEDGEEGSCLVVKSRDGKMLIPFSKIYYLEAKEKKIFVRLLREEYALYDTLENIRRSLPGYFVRTHRSFLVNSRMIERVRVSEHTAVLQDGFLVPLSRSCRNELKELGL